MIFAEKLVQLRKKEGWSQEDLAERMNVSRQSVAKWEGAQSVPELEKILRLSQIFGVSTDYLLKDEMGEEEYTNEPSESENAVRRVSMEEANAFLASRPLTALRIAVGVVMCILSPIPLLLMGSLSGEAPGALMSENVAGGLGALILLMIIAGAVGIFIYSGLQDEKYEYLEKEQIETEYGVCGLAKQKKQKFQSTYVKYNIFGAVLCILAASPILLGAIFWENNDILMTAMVCVTLALAAAGVFFFILAGVVQEGFEMLLNEGDYTRKKKKLHHENEAFSGIYWGIVTVLYLAVSFLSFHWHRTWIIWPIAAVLYSVITALYNLLRNKEEK